MRTDPPMGTQLDNIKSAVLTTEWLPVYLLCTPSHRALVRVRKVPCSTCGMHMASASLMDSLTGQESVLQDPWHQGWKQKSLPV